MDWLFPADDGARRRRDRVLLVLAVLLGLFLVARAARKDQGVLVRNQEFGRRFLERVDPYDSAEQGHWIHRPYPPSYAWITAPLALLPTPVARVAWAAAQFAALVAVYALLRRRTRAQDPELAPHVPVLFALALVLASRFVLRDTSGGGGNLIYLALALAGLELALAGRELRAAALFALGLALKPNLAPLLLFLAAHGRWRVPLAAVAGALVLAALPALHHGGEAWAGLWRRWIGDVSAYAAQADLHDWEATSEGMPRARSAMNQSLRSAVHRVVRPPGDSGAPDVSVATVSPAAARRAAQVLAAALAVACVLAARSARTARAEHLAALAFFPLALLVSPVTWKAHHAVLLPLFYALVVEARRPRAPRWLAPLLVAAWVATGLLSEEVTGKAAKEWLQAASVVTWFDVALLAAALRLARRADAEGTVRRQGAG